MHTASDGVSAERGDDVELPPGVLRIRVGPGANCSSAGSAIVLLFYGSVVVSALAVALAAAYPVGDAADTDDETDESRSDGG